MCVAESLCHWSTRTPDPLTRSVCGVEGQTQGLRRRGEQSATGSNPALTKESLVEAAPYSVSFMPPEMCLAGRPAQLRRKRRATQLAGDADILAPVLPPVPPATADGTLATLQQDVLLMILAGLQVRHASMAH